MRVPASLVLVAPVSLPVPTGDWSIRGTLCAPPGADTVQLLQHGALFDHHYWHDDDLPARYDYVANANAHGYATLNVDRLGVGRSTHPAPELVTSGAEARIAHLLVQRLRDGSFGESFSHVVLVGHSFGSAIAADEAGTYHDVDAVVLTGFTHDIVPGAVYPFTTSLAPAFLAQPERFGDLAPGYLTSRDHRISALYYQPDADPAVIDHDNAIRQTITDGEVATFANTEAKTALIDTPVLAVVGNHDRIFCGVIPCQSALSQTQLEQAFYPSAASFRLAIVPKAGHALNHQRNAPRTDATIDRWLADHVT
jgi:pimeloyl-ACP methyl ester carboxylesterase